MIPCNLFIESVPDTHTHFLLNNYFTYVLIPWGLWWELSGFGGATSRDGRRAMFPFHSQENFFRQREEPWGGCEVDILHTVLPV